MFPSSNDPKQNKMYRNGLKAARWRSGVAESNPGPKSNKEVVCWMEKVFHAWSHTTWQSLSRKKNEVKFGFCLLARWVVCIFWCSLYLTDGLSRSWPLHSCPLEVADDANSCGVFLQSPHSVCGLQLLRVHPWFVSSSALSPPFNNCWCSCSAWSTIQTLLLRSASPPHPHHTHGWKKKPSAT